MLTRHSAHLFFLILLSYTFQALKGAHGNILEESSSTIDLSEVNPTTLIRKMMKLGDATSLRGNFDLTKDSKDSDLEDPL